MITEEGGESEVWREMKDRAKEYHSPILIQAILSSRKTRNQAVNTKGNKPSIDHLNHLIRHRNHLNHLIHHLNHLIHYLNHLIDHLHHLSCQIEPEDLLQCWQNNIHSFSKHCRKLEADLDSRAEVLQSSSVLFTSIQVKIVLIQVSDVIDSDGRQVSNEPELCTTCTRIKVSREPQLLFLLPNHWKELHLV